MAVLHDITDFKATEEALRQMNEGLERKVSERTAELKATNDELGTFTHIISHDLRSPLINLKGFASELRLATETIRDAISNAQILDTQASQNVQQAIEKDIPQALSFIESAVMHMDHLTSAVLNLSRMGRRELTLEPVDMDAAVKIVLDSMAHQIKERQVTITLEPLTTVQADRFAMEQIIGNILSNAVKYLRQDIPGEISIRNEIVNGEAIFHVADNGRGIAEADRHKVFEPFRRAGKPDVPGDGMGLAYVQLLVRRHGGQIWFTSEQGVGTTFSFSIPLKV
jgi:signal transduction histidine kinase